MTRDFPIRDGSRFAELAQTWLRGEIVPAEVALASTVMLVREGPPGPGGEAQGRSPVEVFLMRRVASMDFAPSVLVFPGGRVDPRDASADVEWAGRDPDSWAAVLDTDVASARLLVTAAIRELFEECGVLLAGPDVHSVVADVSSALWHERRMALTRHEVSLGEVLAEEDLVLRTDLLGYRAHWVTPGFERRRYDTRFFCAAVPDGQVPDGQTTEADHAQWADPATTLESFERGEVMMLPPTQACLEELSDATSVESVVTDAVDVLRVLPELAVLDSGDVVLRTPLPERTAPGPGGLR